MRNPIVYPGVRCLFIGLYYVFSAIHFVFHNLGPRFPIPGFAEANIPCFTEPVSDPHLVVPNCGSRDSIFKFSNFSKFSPKNRGAVEQYFAHSIITQSEYGSIFSVVEEAGIQVAGTRLPRIPSFAIRNENRFP